MALTAPTEQQAPRQMAGPEEFSARAEYWDSEARKWDQRASLARFTGNITGAEASEKYATAARETARGERKEWVLRTLNVATDTLSLEGEHAGARDVASVVEYLRGLL